MLLLCVRSNIPLKATGVAPTPTIDFCHNMLGVFGAGPATKCDELPLC